MLKYHLVPNFEKESVKYLQELLCLLGQTIAIDGDFGPATRHAVETWRTKVGAVAQGNPDDVYESDIVMMLKATGLDVCGDLSRQQALYLGAGLTQAEIIKTMPEPTFGDMAVMVAKAHASFRPREVGPDNHGPWVRLYMDGQEGLPWCAGFVSTIYKQTQKILGVQRPIPGSWSCTALANQAMGAGKFAKGEDLWSKDIKPGSLFVRRKKRQDGTYFGDAWEHTGIIVEDLRTKNLIRTLEGNTNDNGSREGFEVCEHILRRDNRDYILA